MSSPPDALSVALTGRYRLERPLGQGGMATVYLAEDLKHARMVALKVLRPDLAAVLGAARFLEEIRITAGLDHPHILHLIDSGESNGFLWYVLPYIRGESLRERLRREPQLPLQDALAIARALASALDYAHRHGVIHRDLKPENVLLFEGEAMLADFGIALAVREAGGSRLTETGLALGTPQYMSPEQATGERSLDARSDIYTLGAVLYEMLTGETPHAGASAQAVIAKLMTTDPVPVEVLRPGVPVGVQNAVRRALAKVPSDRWGSAGEFAEALAGEQADRRTDGQTRSGSQPARPPVRPSAVMAVLAVATMAVLAIAWRLLGHRPLALTTTNAIPITSEPGMEFQPAISPDGSQVAYVAQRTGRQVIVVRSTRQAASRQFLPAEETPGRQSFPRWSPDGELIRFWSCIRGEKCRWMEVPRLGGGARPLDLPRQSRTTAWSHDGKQAAFIIHDTIYLYTIESRSTRLLAVQENGWDPHSLAWSPDDRRIAYVEGNPFWLDGVNVNSASVWIVGAGDGRRVRVTADPYLNVSPAWIDRSHLLFVSNRGGPREIYLAEVASNGPRGAPVKVPGGTDLHSISLSADGKTLAVARITGGQNVRAYPTTGREAVSIRDGRAVTSGTQIVETHEVSPDGQWLVYTSDLVGTSDLYKKRLEGGDPIPLVTTPDQEYNPRWSPDGKEILFDNGANLWLVSSEGGPVTRLAEGREPRWSPDGRQIVYIAGEFRPWLLSRADPGAPWGQPVPLADYFCWIMDWAPDGSILCRTGNVSVFALLSPSGGLLQRIDLSGPGLGGSNPVYSDDGKTLYGEGRHDGHSGVWAVRLAGGKPLQIVAFDDSSLEARTYGGAIEVSHGQLYMTVADYQSDIWVMDLKR
jgi:eukaryotic-like serine/threonine-protein kinase